MDKKKSRMRYSLINSTVSSIGQIIMIILGFVAQTVFIHELGSTYLGIKGLFSNILSVLSFTELGIGTAITYTMYKPLSENNEQQIALIMNFFKKAYETIGGLVAIFGITLIPFIHYFTHTNIPGIYVYYLLYLLNTVISYFYTYKRTLLNADQQNYINSLNNMFFNFITIILQIAVLLIYKSFLGYLVIQFIGTLVSNVSVSKIVDKKYPFLKNEDYYDKKLPTKTVKEIFHNTIGLIGSKIGSIVVLSTDNILISYFIGLSSVGLYSNYMLVVNNLNSIIGTAMGSVTASIGNLAVEKNDKDYQYEIFEKSFFVAFATVFFCAVCSMTLLNPFIQIWVGNKYKLSNLTVFCIVFEFILIGLRQIFTSFVSAYGLYIKDGKKAIVESIVNFVLSVIYIKYFHLGIAGVVLGTISSNFLVNWYEPYIVMKYGIKLPNKLPRFYLKCLAYIIITTCIMLVFSCTLPMLFKKYNIINFLILLIITVILTLVVFILFFRKSRYFDFLISIMKRMVNRLKKM